MTEGTLDLIELVNSLADRKATRTEATVQSTLHALLLASPLQLEDAHLRDIVLEHPAGKRRRIDVEVGCCVFEVKRDLRKGHVREDAEVQPAQYVADRIRQTAQRYVGVLTDGCEWHLFRLQGDRLVQVGRPLVVAPKDPRHVRLFELGEQAESFVAQLELLTTRFEKQRRYVREQLEASEIGKANDAEVAALLGVVG